MLARRFFLRGLITILPIIFTVAILLTAYRFVDQYVSGPVNAVLYSALEKNALGWQALRAMGVDPESIEYLDGEHLPLDLAESLRTRGSGDSEFRRQLETFRVRERGLWIDLASQAIDAERLRRDVTSRVPRVVGLVASLLLVLSLGSLAGGYIGTRLLNRTEGVLHAIPIVRSIYPYTKQLVDFFFSEKKIEFDTVVAVEYPRAGVWSLGFLTSAGIRSLRQSTGLPLVSVFIPSSPMPMTGYTVFVPEHTLVRLPFSVDEALRTIVSGGVLVPLQERMGPPPPPPEANPPQDPT